ncbi:hypothetical protein ACFQ1L_32910 [Phytohabitans flavus]|uniref:hypothetical protein n=1 Tax=Phytohabitans flavus TaxID=1076124 RepID=UPI001562EB69|nr:hypothetical protein [Phytohabitans flavus]
MSASERRLLKRILAAAVLSGIVLGVADTATGSVDQAGSGTAATQAANDLDSIQAQFAEAFTPGDERSNVYRRDIGLVA